MEEQIKLTSLVIFCFDPATDWLHTSFANLGKCLLKEQTFFIRICISLPSYVTRMSLLNIENFLCTTVILCAMKLNTKQNKTKQNKQNQEILQQMYGTCINTFATHKNFCIFCWLTFP